MPRPYKSACRFSTFPCIQLERITWQCHCTLQPAFGVLGVGSNHLQEGVSFPRAAEGLWLERGCATVIQGLSPAERGEGVRAPLSGSYVPVRDADLQQLCGNPEDVCILGWVTGRPVAPLSLDVVALIGVGH